MRNVVTVGNLPVNMLVAQVEAELDAAAEDGLADGGPVATNVVTDEAANLLNGGVLPDTYRWNASTGDITAPPGALGWFNCDPLSRVIAGAVARMLRPEI